MPRLGSLTGRDLPLRTPQTVLEDGELREVGETRDQDTARYDEPVLRVEKLTTRFDVGHNLFGRVTHRVHAVEEVSFDVYPGETLALVGESGSGKSTIGKTLQQLIAPTGGAVRYNGRTSSPWTAPAANGCARRSSTSSRIPMPRWTRARPWPSASPNRSARTACCRTRPPSRAASASCWNRWA